MKRALGLGVALVLAWSANAHAFCRSTTCRGECPTDENGCPSTGAKLFWPGACVGYAVQKDGTHAASLDDVRVAVQKSFEAWSDVPCPDQGGKFATMTFSELQDVSCKKSQYDKDGPNVNVVLFRDDDWSYKGIDGTLAKTSVTYDDRTGEIFDADIELNAAFNDLTVTDDAAKIGYDLRSILTHEAGHFIGLAHTPDPDATMYAAYARGTTIPRDLAPDDVAAICALYPPGRASTCDPTPHGGLGMTCDDPPPKKCAIAGDGDGDLGGAAVIGMIVIASVRRRVAITARAGRACRRSDRRA